MNFARLKASLSRPMAWWPGRGAAAAPGGVAVATASRLHLTVGLDDDLANERAGAAMLDAAANRVPLAKVAVAKMAVDQATFDRRQQEIAAYNADHAPAGSAAAQAGRAAQTLSTGKDGAAPVLDKALPVRRRASDVPVQAAPQRLPVRARPPLDLQTPVIWGLAVLVLGSVGFITWAATAPLAEGVPAEGYVKVETNRKPVQHLRGGVVDEIMVRDGERVTAGQVLMRLNDSDVKSRSAVIESRMMSALALQARLLAERQGARELVFPAELRDAPEQSAAADAMRTQQQLFGARRSGLFTDVAMQESNASSLETYIRGLRAQAEAKTEQIRLLQVELDSLRELAAQGYVPRARVSDIERQIALLQGQRAEDMGNIGRVRGSVSESRMKIQQRRTESTKDIETQLTEVQSRVNELREQRASLRDELDRTLVKAPSEGVVVDLAVHSVGAVINPSQRILDVVPARVPLIVEAQVPARLFDNLQNGMACDVRFTGPDQSVTRPVKGHVSYIAADRSIDAARGESYFITRVQITDQALAEAGLKVMQPGMPATVMITTAHRSLLHYLVAPLGKRLPGALSER
ncbi:MAG: HlyD family type I secretion periplasmic adaptor subunit [Burkholderiales bacterium]|nr:HlyD family type I secretion periplasmic adaptor subunit [Burkholderiales bacterium]